MTRAAYGAANIFRSSERTRSAESPARPALSAIAAANPSPSSRPSAKRAEKRRKRRIRQEILADPQARVADETHLSCREIGEAAGVVVDEAAGVDRKRVDGEIPPQRVGMEIAAEAHFGAPPVGLDVLAKRGRFDRRAFEQQRDSAVRDAGWRVADPGRVGAANDLRGVGGGGDVEIARWRAEQEIAHRAANQPRLLAVRVEQL